MLPYIATPLALQLSGVLPELSYGASFSEILQLDLIDAPCRGHAKRLILGQCDSAGIEWYGYMRQTWVADCEGLHDDPAIIRWPSSKQMNDEKYMSETPRVIFATDGRQAALWCRFGVLWRGFRECDLDAAGTIIPGTMVPSYPTSR